MARAYFAAYHSYLGAVEPLGDAERGRLFTACLRYSMTGEETELSGDERFVWPFIRSQIDRDAGKYEACRRNGALGGRARAAARDAAGCGPKRNMANSGETQRTPPEKKKASEKEKENSGEKEKESAEEGAFADTANAEGGADVLPEGLRAAMERFSEHRAKLNAPITGYTAGLALKRAKTLAGGDEAKTIAILEQSVQRGWKGVFPLETEAPRRAPPKKTRPPIAQHAYTEEQFSRLLVDLDGPPETGENGEKRK